MFSFVAIILILSTGQTQARVNSESSFNTYQECADSIPDEILRLNKAAEGHPVLVALGCMKTGERS